MWSCTDMITLRAPTRAGLVRCGAAGARPIGSSRTLPTSSYTTHNARLSNIIPNNKIFARFLYSGTRSCEQHAICTAKSGDDSISKALVYME